MTNLHIKYGMSQSHWNSYKYAQIATQKQGMHNWKPPVQKNSMHLQCLFWDILSWSCLIEIIFIFTMQTQLVPSQEKKMQIKGKKTDEVSPLENVHAA